MKIIPMEEPEIATVGTKGQVVIPLQVRRELGIKPRTKLAIYGFRGKLVASKIEAPTQGEELDALFREIDGTRKGTKRPTEREILAAVQAYRRERPRPKGA